MNFLYKNAVVGGTFDRFHKGHEKLLEITFSQARNVTVGISTESLYKRKLLSKTIESFEIRRKSVFQYLNAMHFDKQAEIVQIDDIYGTTLEQKEIDAIFITEENSNAASLINEKRKEKGFPELKIITVPFVNDFDGTTISSERIRKGEIDREGYVYESLFRKRSLVLPEKLRAKLRTPHGKIYTDMQQVIARISHSVMVIAVGDIVTYSLAKEGRQADLSIIDFMTRRHALKDDEKSLLEKMTTSAETVQNQAGKIEMEAVQLIKGAFEQFLTNEARQTIKIDGEEDLLTLPAILLAPLQSYVVYGQYDQGAVIVEVTEQKKKEIRDLVEQFSS